MADEELHTFEEFWRFYVREHRQPATRILHFAGTTAAMACVAGALLTKRKWLLLIAPLLGYGPAWVSHFFVEGNKPATFRHPLWSLRADLVMWSKMVRFQMADEVERILREDEERAREPVEAQPPAPTPSAEEAPRPAVDPSMN